MKIASLLTSLAVVACAAARATPKRDSDWQDCLSQAEAESIVSQYITILEHSDVAAANATAQSLLADGYTETSDSILSLEGFPLGTATFVGKDVYIDGVLNSPPVSGVETIEILVAGCTKVLWYWNFLGIGSGQYEIKGFNLFDVTSSLQVSAVHLEFNSIAWGLDTGYQVIPPSGPPPTMRR